jgi:hypothetical protein
MSELFRNENNSAKIKLKNLAVGYKIKCVYNRNTRVWGTEKLISFPNSFYQIQMFFDEFYDGHRKGWGGGRNP